LYGKNRDLPALDGTSVLSPYLAAGAISARACLAAAREADGGRVRLGGRRPSGLGVWIGELIWREFYTHITHAYPRLCKGHAFKPIDRAVAWRYDEGEFGRWRRGETGFPFVDAAMRQLNATGWMHNRLRMVAAMFLAKDLLIDWRWGERYFMRRLVDGDLASNNGGWQWSASTGTDAVPYFRVYNPTTQARRYDPDGVFVRRWLPELADLTGRGIFEPSSGRRAAYPLPMVDHEHARARAIAGFKAAAGREGRRRGAGSG
jgi:deoxyribodipyrimidine photo-lyase